MNFLPYYKYKNQKLDFFYQQNHSWASEGLKPSEAPWVTCDPNNSQNHRKKMQIKNPHNFYFFFPLKPTVPLVEQIKLGQNSQNASVFF